MKARTDFPYSGKSRLLHQPVIVRYFVVWSQGNVCSSHWNTLGISITSVRSMLGSTSISSCRPLGSLSLNSASFSCRYLRPLSSACKRLSRNLRLANWSTYEELDTSTACVLGFENAYADPMGDSDSAIWSAKERKKGGDNGLGYG